MIKFNVHYTTKDNKRNAVEIEANDGDSAIRQAKLTVKDICYVNKVKFKAKSTNEISPSES